MYQFKWRAIIFFSLQSNNSYRPRESNDDVFEKTTLLSVVGCTGFLVCNIYCSMRLVSSHEQTMDLIFSMVIQQVVLNYLDHIIIFARPVECQILHAGSIILQLHQCDVTLNLNEYNFFTENKDYFRRKIWPYKLELADRSTKKARNSRTPAMHLSWNRFCLSTWYWQFAQFWPVKLLLTVRNSKGMSMRWLKLLGWGARTTSDASGEACTWISTFLTFLQRTFIVSHELLW